MPENREVKNAWRKKVRIEAIEKYGPTCRCCGEWRYNFLALDHINHGKGNPAPRKVGEHLAEALRRDGWPEGIQVLCHNCNHCKGQLGYCVHEQERN